MENRKIELWFLLGYLLIFAALFLIALYDFSKGSSVLNIGFDPKVTSIVMMVLSFAGILKTIYHLYIFEMRN